MIDSVEPESISEGWLDNIHRFRTRVYYDATDTGGVVYHSEYLNIADHARTESLRAYGINQRELLNKEGVSIVVRHCSVDFRQSAKLDDLVEIRTSFQKLSGVKIIVDQFFYLVVENKVKKDCLVHINLNLVCINRNGKATRIPTQLKQFILKIV